MATLILSAVGAASGGALGFNAFGLTSTAIGRALGATVGRFIDQSILGTGSQAVEHGRVERIRLTGASEGAPIPQIYGRARVSGQAIWSSRFLEHKRKKRAEGGKGASRGPEITSYRYTISVAFALCEGDITRVGRIWADGTEIAARDLDLRVYKGTESQQPDPRMEAIEGKGNVPAYRGLAYVVIEDLDVSPYGNRIPQFSFEVMRPEQPGISDAPIGLARSIRAVRRCCRGRRGMCTGDVASAYSPTTPAAAPDGPDRPGEPDRRVGDARLLGAHHLEGELRYPVAVGTDVQILDDDVGEAAVGRDVALALDRLHPRVRLLGLGPPVDAEVEIPRRDLGPVRPDAADAGDLTFAERKGDADRVAVAGDLGPARRTLAAFGSLLALVLEKPRRPDRLPRHARAPVRFAGSERPRWPRSGGCARPGRARPPATRFPGCSGR